MADGGVWTLLSDEQMTALEVDERWYRVYPPLIPEPVVLPPFELIGTFQLSNRECRVAEVFDSSKYLNYMVVIEGYITEPAGGGDGVKLQLMDGSQLASGNDYTEQLLRVNDNIQPYGVRQVRDRINVGFFPDTDTSSTQAAGISVMIYGPAKDNQRTAFRSVEVTGRAKAQMYEWAGTHSQPKAYNGFRIFNLDGDWTGTLSVYGVRS